MVGRGLDVQKWLAKTGIEFHWPGYQYMGPGTHLEKRLKRGDPGINRLDRIAKQHDIDYSRARSHQDKWKADDKMIRAIPCSYPCSTTHPGYVPLLYAVIFAEQKSSSCEALKGWSWLFFPSL